MVGRDSDYNAFNCTLIQIGFDLLDIYAPDVTKYYGGSERFVVTLTEENNPIPNVDVKITINGQTYTRTTDENSIASMGINLNSGVYDVISQYNNIQVKSDVTIKNTVIAKDFTKII